MNAIDIRLAAKRLRFLRSGTTWTTLRFTDQGGMTAAEAATAWLAAYGFSAGPCGDPQRKRAILHGRYIIPTWGDLTADDLAQVDGRVRDDDASSVIEILPDAFPPAIAAALDRVAA